jgi:hypothetical protein
MIIAGWYKGQSPPAPRVIAGKLYTAKKVRATKGAAVLRNESRAMQGE